MLWFVLTASLALVPLSISNELPAVENFLNHLRFGNINVLCDVFCDGLDDLNDFISRSIRQDLPSPRIFCEICKKKTTTSTKPTLPPTTTTTTTEKSSDIPPPTTPEATKPTSTTQPSPAPQSTQSTEATAPASSPDPAPATSPAPGS